MKNVLLKSLGIFIVMSLLNAQFTEWTLQQTHLPVGNYGMLPILIIIECAIVSVVGFVTVLIFKKHYNSIFRIAMLFEILYLLLLIISGVNPFLYFFERIEDNLLNLFLYLNSFLIFIIILIFEKCLKLISSKNQNLP
ncbi:hypothetical protein ACOOWA_09775 [Chryseobacterium sp. GP-SGM7]